MPTDDLEKRLSSLSLRRPTDTYSAKGGQIIREHSRGGNRHAVYLNYALALSLLLSLGANFLLLTDYRQEMSQLAAQCDINPAEASRGNGVPGASHRYPPLKVVSPETIEHEPVYFC